MDFKNIIIKILGHEWNRFWYPHIHADIEYFPDVSLQQGEITK